MISYTKPPIRIDNNDFKIDYESTERDVYEQKKVGINIQFFAKSFFKKKSLNSCDIPGNTFGLDENHTLIHKKLILNRVTNISDLQIEIVHMLTNEKLYIPAYGSLKMYDAQNGLITNSRYIDGKINLSRNPVITVVQE